MRTTMRKHKRKSSEITRVRSMAPSYRSSTAQGICRSRQQHVALNTESIDTGGHSLFFGNWDHRWTVLEACTDWIMSWRCRNYNLYSKMPDTQIEYNRMLHSTIYRTAQYNSSGLARPCMFLLYELWLISNLCSYEKLQLCSMPAGTKFKVGGTFLWSKEHSKVPVCVMLGLIKFLL